MTTTDQTASEKIVMLNIDDPVVTGEVNTKPITTPPPMFCVLRAGEQSPSRFPANSEEEAIHQIRNQVRTASGAVQIVYLYKLICAEEFVSSSNNLTPAQIQERIQK